MTRQRQTTTPPSISNTRYRLNLILLLVVGLLFTLWFYRHLQLYVTETVLIGGTITFWTLWKILGSLMNWTFGSETDTFAQRLIGKPWATEYLALSLFPLAALYGTTASVYLVYEGAESGESTFQVDVLHNQNPYMERIEVTSSSRVAGKPFFLCFKSVDLEYRIFKPGGFRSLQKRLHPWSGTYLRVPQDFERLNLVRLIASPALYVKLPDIKDTPRQRYYLDIEYKGQHYRIDDLRRQIVYTGALERELMELSENDDSAILRQELDDYLARHDLRRESREPIIATLLKEASHLAAGEFRSGDKIIIAVGKLAGNECSDAGQSKQLLRKVYHVKNKAMQTIWLEFDHG